MQLEASSITAVLTTQTNVHTDKSQADESMDVKASQSEVVKTD